MTEYRTIPNFKNYAITNKGEVIHLRTLNKVKIVNGKINLTGDWGKRTTRRKHVLMKEIWGSR